MEESEGDEIFEEEGVEPLQYSLLDYYDEIDQLEDSMPKDRRSKEYKIWVVRINKKMKEANEMAGNKIYKLIK